MSTYSEADFDTKHYGNARPTYPQELYDELLKYHGNERELAVDIGTGSGFVAYKLTEYFTKVIGTDPSKVMIESCKSDPKFHTENIEFAEGTGEALPIEDGTVDLLTGAECCHWVDHAKFFKESARVLKKNGTLAYWFYKDPVFIGYPEANKIYNNYTWQSSLEQNPDDEIERWMGPYYQQPGHNFLGTLMKEIEVPTDLFHDIVREEYLVDNAGKSLSGSTTALLIKKTITISQFLDYVKSWSAYHNWMKDHGSKYDIAERFVDELKEKLGWEDNTRVEVVWDTMYTFAKKN